MCKTVVRSALPFFFFLFLFFFFLAWHTCHCNFPRVSMHACLSNSKETLPLELNRIVGPVVKASASRAADPGFDSRFLRGKFSWSRHTGDLKVGTPLAALPGAWRCRVSGGTGWSGVSVL